jgi:mannose-6-phosphate isomerase-like protein (cupin superfamily)
MVFKEEIFIKQYPLLRLAATMKEDVILIKKGEQKSEVKRPGKLYRLLIKSPHIEAIIAELEPHAESRWFQHDGEEMHFVLQGHIEYTVGEKSYKLKEGDTLWHSSSLKHRARNLGNEKVVYMTVGTPPTFMWSTL